MLQAIKNIFGRGKRTVKGPGIMVRTYLPAYQQNEANFDFFTNGQGEDANLYTALPILRRQARALHHTNGIYSKFDQTVRVNVIGSEGYSFQSRVWDKEPQVGAGGKLIPGRPDIGANMKIEAGVTEWQRAEYCTVTGKMPWQQVREERISMTARDGACLVRKFRGKQFNKFGFTTQLLNIDYLAHDKNESMKGGVEIRMGVERNQWGRTLAYHLNKQGAGDWRSNANDYSRGDTVRVPAEDIILSCKLTDSDATLAAPWCTPVMQLLYQIDAMIEAEVVAVRAAACKGGYFFNKMSADDPAGLSDTKNWQGENVQVVGPNETRALPYGWEFQQYDPKHPTAHFSEARKALTQAASVGLRVPYYCLSGDLADANNSSLRVGETEVRENWKIIQTWDIQCNEIPIFEPLLEQALLMRAIDLPFENFAKYNRPAFRGKRWAWVDPMKEVQAHIEALKHGFTTRARIIADMTQADFEDVIQELATEEGVLASAGLESLTLEMLNAKPGPVEPADDAEEEEKPKPKKKPAAKARFSTNGIH